MRRAIVSVLWFLIGGAQAFAQCAMCRTQVENNVSNGDTSFAAGLNFGILYLFAAPYLMVMVIAFLWYRKSRQKSGSPSFPNRRIS